MIVALRLLLLAVAAAALAVALAIGVRGRGDTQTAVRYACPMHPEARASEPGECPICRMALERVGKPAAPLTRATACDNADFAAVENVRRHNIVDFVRRRSLLVPARELRGPAAVEPDGTVSALFYDDELAALDDDELGIFTPTAAPQLAFRVRRQPGATERWDRSTSRIHFRFTPAGRAAPGTLPPRDLPPRDLPPRDLNVGWVELAPRPRQVLAVPASAILQSPEGPYVLAWTGVGFDFEKRPVEIGETFLKQGFAVVLSGLRVNERVVGRATFFLEADRRATNGAIETGWSSL